MASLFRIALVGAPGSGKSSIGDALINLAGGQRLSFAAGVKEEAARVLLASDTELVTPNRDGTRMLKQEHEERIVERMNHPDTKDEYRRLLQVWGTDYRRADNPNYWVEKWAVTFNAIRENENIVVDDCRFPNEYEALTSNGFYVVRLASGSTTRPQDPLAAVHESESYWPEFDVHLELSYKAGPEWQARRILREVLEG